jgi:spore photoproduct lyase
VKLFQPDLVYFEPAALNYPLGRELMGRFRHAGLPIQMTSSHNRITNLPGSTDIEKYRIAKRTLVIGVRKKLDFDPSKPSAEFALPLATGCAGHCHYCYLQTTLGNRPYIRVYVNLDEIFAQAERYINERTPEITRFEAAGTSDPVSIEHLTGSLKQAIEFMGKQKLGRLRFVTKFAHVDPLLDANHCGHTRFRFSVNAPRVVKQYEPATSGLEERIRAAARVREEGYPLGFIIAPILLFPSWKEKYEEMLSLIARHIPRQAEDLTFELITHRFTTTAKKVIAARYPKTTLPMAEEERNKKWGRYGRIKYVYPDEQMSIIERFMREAIARFFPGADISYFT